jgi:hypothetical protein
MGTNWFIPALVNKRFGESGIRLEDGTIVCCFDLKKSRNDCRISALVIYRVSVPAGGGRQPVASLRRVPGREGHTLGQKPLQSQPKFFHYGPVHALPQIRR